MSRVIAKYKLIKDLPGLHAGAIFEHREYDNKFPDRGNRSSGCMILGWGENKPNNWGGECYIFPGQLAKNSEWFKNIECEQVDEKKFDFDKELRELNQRIKTLESKVGFLQSKSSVWF